MFEILPLYGIPLPFINAIKSLYIDTTATVITPDGETSPFEVTAGVLQGDTLAPFLFIMVLDYILRLSLDTMQEKGIEIQPRRSRRYPAVNLTDLDFADDLALVTQLIKDAETLLQSLEKAAAQVEKRLDGTYTNLLRRAKNLSWKQHPTLTNIYGNLPKVSQKLSQRRLQFAGHCYRTDQEVISSLILWRPWGKTHCRKLTYPSVLLRDTGYDIEDLKSAMADREMWAGVVQRQTPSPRGVD
ncbi:hypothetical protein Bbelb_066160 [Branchiostoma belcheri]|nr:hypothetical protein Bbelb_066160 [Branchiostoma belcheri]